MLAVARPPWSRTTLKWHKLDEIGPNQWIVNLLPPYYAAVFEQQEPDLMDKARGPWRESKSGNSSWTTFDNLSEDDLNRIEKFMADYEQFILLNTNRHIESHFFDELDCAMAMDLNFRDGEYGAYTEVGELVYHAKYRKRIAAAEELGRRLCEVIRRVPTGGFDGPCCLTYVPPGRHKRYDLPRLLAKWMVEYGQPTVELRQWEPLVEPELTIPKPDFKRLTVDEKIRVWERLLGRGTRLSSSVAGYGVYVIDDLYQSGATLWSYARFLKAAGATAVFALACEKSRGDRDNR
jgi:hypothetical protein